jgi:hypothetical protein
VSVTPLVLAAAVIPESGVVLLTVDGRIRWSKEGLFGDASWAELQSRADEAIAGLK